MSLLSIIQSSILAFFFLLEMLIIIVQEMYMCNCILIFNMLYFNVIAYCNIRPSNERFGKNNVHFIQINIYY